MPKTEPMPIGQRLRVARERQAKTRREVAAALDVTERTLFEWETGRTPPKRPMLEAWCAFLGITAP